MGEKKKKKAATLQGGKLSIKKGGQIARHFTGFYLVSISTFFALGLLGSLLGKVIFKIPS